MASSTKGQDELPTRHFGRGFASIDPERQREIVTQPPARQPAARRVRQQKMVQGVKQGGSQGAR